MAGASVPSRDGWTQGLKLSPVHSHPRLPRPRPHRPSPSAAWSAAKHHLLSMSAFRISRFAFPLRLRLRLARPSSIRSRQHSGAPHASSSRAPRCDHDHEHCKTPLSLVLCCSIPVVQFFTCRPYYTFHSLARLIWSRSAAAWSLFAEHSDATPYKIARAHPSPLAPPGPSA